MDFGEVWHRGRWLVGEFKVGFENGIGEVGVNSMNASSLLTRRGSDPRNWNRILGFRLVSPQLLLLLWLLLLLQVRLLCPSSPRYSPATWRRSRSFSFTTSPPWRESLVRKLIGECRWRELAILTRTATLFSLEKKKWIYFI